MRSVLLVALAVAMLATPTAAQHPDRVLASQIHAVVQGYHAALAAGDSAAALGLLHPDVLIFEAGHAETLAQYRAGHLRSDMAFARATRREVEEAAITAWGEQALYTAVSRTSGHYQDRPIDVRGAETMVLVRTDDGWRICHVHWSSQR